MLHKAPLNSILNRGTKRVHDETDLNVTQICPTDRPEMSEYDDFVEMRKNEAGEPYDDGARKRLAQVMTPTSMYWCMFSEGGGVNDTQPDKRKRGRPPYFLDP